MCKPAKKDPFQHPVDNMPWKSRRNAYSRAAARTIQGFCRRYLEYAKCHNAKQSFFC